MLRKSISTRKEMSMAGRFFPETKIGTSVSRSTYRPSIPSPQVCSHKRPDTCNHKIVEYPANTDAHGRARTSTDQHGRAQQASPQPVPASPSQSVQAPAGPCRSQPVPASPCKPQPVPASPCRPCRPCRSLIVRDRP
jgi:hypothetical protein